MLNILEDYYYRSLPDWGGFTTNPGLEKKVSPSGQLLPFYGNTVVFDLEEDTKVQLRQLQEELYRKASRMLSEPLSPDTFHVTLHDLVNGPENKEVLRRKMEHTGRLAREFLERWRDQPPIAMEATWLFNMVNTSIVLGLRPVNGDSWNRLDGMYMALETVVRLGYRLTPHITMAYFRPGTYEDIRELRKALKPVSLKLELDPMKLQYQEFTDMNHYLAK